MLNQRNIQAFMMIVFLALLPGCGGQPWGSMTEEEREDAFHQLGQNQYNPNSTLFNNRQEERKRHMDKKIDEEFKRSMGRD